MSAAPLFAPPGPKTELEEGAALTPRFDRDGLITAIVTDADDGELLMVAHMNAEALTRTIETAEGWFWSRSRAELWHKGATSGTVLKVADLRVDCDQDAVWLKVRVEGAGVSCHTGRRSCFYRSVPLGAGAPALAFTEAEPRVDPATLYGKK